MQRKEAEAIVDAIIFDLSDRRGLRQEWGQIDRPLRNDIREEWILLTLAAAKAQETP